MKKLLDFTASPILRLLTERKPKPAEPAVDPQIMQAIRDLTEHPKWPLYKALLDIRITNATHAMLAADADSQCHYYRGYITGLCHAAQIPEKLVADEDNAARRKQRRDAAADAGRDSGRDALYATGYWGN